MDTYWTLRMPFCLSSGGSTLVDLSSAMGDEREDLAGDVALDAADRLELGVAFGNALGDIGLGSGVRPEPANGDDVQRAVRRSVAASVQAMAGGSTRGGGDRTDAAQGREAGFGTQAFGVVAGREQQLRGRGVADRVPGHQLRGELVD